MKRTFLYLVVTFSTYLTSFPVLAELNPVAEGARLFNDNCSRCHNARPAQEFSEREWSVIMPHMREKAHLSGSETLAVEAFIAVTFTADKVGRVVTQSEGETGEDIIARFACSGCHKINGGGGTVGPGLNGVVQRMGADMVQRKLLEPTFNNPSSSMPSFPLTPAQAAKIVDVLRTQ